MRALMIGVAGGVLFIALQVLLFAGAFDAGPQPSEEVEGLARPVHGHTHLGCACDNRAFTLSPVG